MRATSLLAIYFLFFAFSAFLLLPFGVTPISHTDEPRVPGQAESAPLSFDLKKLLGRAALLAAALTFLYTLNYVQGWITTDMFDVVGLG